MATAAQSGAAAAQVAYGLLTEIQNGAPLDRAMTQKLVTALMLVSLAVATTPPTAIVMDPGDSGLTVPTASTNFNLR